MRMPFHTEIIIKNTPEVIWDYIWVPEHWTASNPEEHLGLEFYSDDNKLKSGTKFYQKEIVAGIYNDLRGQLKEVKRPEIVIWEGVATYKKIGDKSDVKINEGGVVKLEKVKDGCKMIHDYYMDFPDSEEGKEVSSYFTNEQAKKAVYDHGYRELEYFKKQLDTD